MRPALRWLESTGSQFSTEQPRFGCAMLSHYTAEYLEWGEGPPLVLAPALAGGVGLVSPLAGLLARDFRVISYQLRGEDDCFSLRRRFGLPDLVQDLGEFLDLLGIETPLLMGVSFGGVLALDFAATHPHRTAAVIAQGADVRFEPSLLRQIAGQVLSRYPLPSDNAFVNQFFNLLFGSKPKDRRLFNFVTRLAWQTDQSVMAHRFRLAEQLDLTEKVGSIVVPTLLLTGERDVLVSEKGLTDMHEGIAGAELVRLPNAGHLAFATHAEAIAGHVRRFARTNNLLENTVALSDVI